VRIVFRDYPLPNHPRALPAAEAARCAQDQGKFWEYHDKLFASQRQLTDADLDRHAAELELDTEAFRACRESGEHRAEVERSRDAGALLGVTGTPAFFINGRPLSGALPFEAFAEIIDEELRGTAGADPATTSPSPGAP
jgi:protein-disulfide isomerase